MTSQGRGLGLIRWWMSRLQLLRLAEIQPQPESGWTQNCLRIIQLPMPVNPPASGENIASLVQAAGVIHSRVREGTAEFSVFYMRVTEIILE